MKKIIYAVSVIIAGYIAPPLITESNAALEEIVVTARKRSESLQDVPIAITAFTETSIEQAGIERPAMSLLLILPTLGILKLAFAALFLLEMLSQRLRMSLMECSTQIQIALTKNYWIFNKSKY